VTEINKGTDDPMKVFFWEIDEIIVISTFCCLGIVLDMFLTLGLLGCGIAYLLTRVKKTSSEGVMLHFLSWHGFYTLKGCPKSYLKELIE
jgi:type IV conjugative transfer system protein TraL